MPSRLTNNEFYNHNANASNVTNSDNYQDDLKLATDDVFSYMCSLAMEKCSKKSEKKKASCGGAAMRKRLLIKNFVAQMLAQERENSSSVLLPGQDCEDSQLDHHNNSMDVDMEEEDEEDEMDEDDEDDEQTNSAQQNRMAEDDNDEEDEEDFDEDEEESNEMASNNASVSIVSAFSATCAQQQQQQSAAHDVMNETIVSMISTQANNTMYNVGQTATTFYDGTTATARSISEWEDFHTVPPTSKDYMLEEEAHCHQENLLYTLYPHHHLQYSAAMNHGVNTNCSDNIGSGYPNGASLAGINIGALPDNLLEDMSIWDEKRHSSMDISSGVNDNSSTALANLVTMVPSMIKIGCCRTEISQASAYRRCITDLDTNTVVEEEYNSNATNCLANRSPRKRTAFAAESQDNSNSLCNLMMLTTSPKRVKL